MTQIRPIISVFLLAACLNAVAGNEIAGFDTQTNGYCIASTADANADLPANDGCVAAGTTCIDAAQPALTTPHSYIQMGVVLTKVNSAKYTALGGKQKDFRMAVCKKICLAASSCRGAMDRNDNHCQLHHTNQAQTNAQTASPSSYVDGTNVPADIKAVTDVIFTLEELKTLLGDSLAATTPLTWSWNDVYDGNKDYPDTGNGRWLGPGYERHASNVARENQANAAANTYCYGKKICKCTNGIGATGATCATHGADTCASCSNGYTLSNGACSQTQASGGGDPLFTDVDGQISSFHGKANGTFCLVSTKNINVNAKFISVPAFFRNPDMTENVLGDVAITMCGDGERHSVLMDHAGVAHVNGKELPVGHHSIMGGAASLTLKNHRCKQPMVDQDSQELECEWVAEESKTPVGMYLTPHRQLLVTQRDGLTVEVNVNFVKPHTDATEFTGQVFHFMDLNLYGQPPGEMHGVLGQKARATSKGARRVEVGMFGKQQESSYVGGLQGEGVIEGVWTDYMVPDLFSSGHAFNMFQC